MIRIDREDYENRVVAALRDEFVEHDVGLDFRGRRIIVEDVKIDRSAPRHLVHILFREQSRLECLFGFSEIAVEGEWDPDPSTDAIVIDPAEGYSGDRNSTRASTSRPTSWNRWRPSDMASRPISIQKK